MKEEHPAWGRFRIADELRKGNKEGRIVADKPDKRVNVKEK